MTALIKNKIESGLAAWSRAKDVAEFMKDKLGELDANGKTKADNIIDNAIIRAQTEERPEWTKVILDATSNKEKAPTQSINNFFGAIAESTNQNVDKLVGKSSTEKKDNIIDII